MRRVMLVSVVLAIGLVSAGWASAAPLDVFADEPALGDGFIRVGCWNLRHINLEGSIDEFLLGTTEENFDTLTQTFAKAVLDLGLDVVAVSEHQPRSDEPNRLQQVVGALNAMDGGGWEAHESEIGYGESGSAVGGLQLAVLWNSDKVTIDPGECVLLSDLRQPRDEDGELEAATHRAPWLVPVDAGALSFDVVIVHLASGGAYPQKDEVDALESYMRDRLTEGDRELLLCGDWNIRPDLSRGRNRLRQLEVPVDGGTLMNILTVDCDPLSLDGWASLDDRDLIRYGDPVADLVSFSHYNANSIDTYLDHVAISDGLYEIFDDPVEVKLAAGGTDVRPGIFVARPSLPEPQYCLFTDHLPVVTILRTTTALTHAGGAGVGLQIVAAMPNPVGSDAQGEEVWVRNYGTASVELAGWRIEDDDGGHWELTGEDGEVNPGATVRVVRNGRPMHLNNDGDTVFLIEPGGDTVDTVSYDEVTSGELVNFQ